MAERRMFTKKITESDAFLDMPSSAQMLYFHLSMNADDDGFANNPKKIQRMCGASDDDYKLLVFKSFILTFDSGVIVIKHWKMHNYIQTDRYKPSVYAEEKAMLGVKENKAYTLDKAQMDTKCIQNGDVGKVRLGKDSIYNNIYCVADNVTDASSNNVKSNYDVSFEDVWKLYPRKINKGAAYKAYRARLNSGYSEEELYQAVKNYADECEKENREPKYIKHCSTFFGASTPFVDYLDKNYIGGGNDGRSGTDDKSIKRDEYAEEFQRLFNESD